MLRMPCRILSVLLLLCFVTGCRSASSALVGKWEHRLPNGSVSTMEYRADGTWTAVNSNTVGNPHGTWKAEGQTLFFTGIPTKTLQWQLSEDGKQLTTQAPNKPAQEWTRE